MTTTTQGFRPSTPNRAAGAHLSTKAFIAWLLISCAVAAAAFFLLDPALMHTFIPAHQPVNFVPVNAPKHIHFHVVDLAPKAPIVT